MSAQADQDHPDSSLVGHNHPHPTQKNFLAVREVMRPDDRFPPHSHPAGQLACAPGGGMIIRVGSSRWRVGSEQFVWIPEQTEHEVALTGATETLNLYFGPELAPRGERWRHPLILPVTPLTIAITRHLCADEPSRTQRKLEVALIRDLLEHTPEAHESLPLPGDARAHTVAQAILADPATNLTIGQWAEQLGVSSKTLLRRFQAETGMTFAQWRTRARVYAAEAMLADGEAVGEVAVRVGFATATGFIRAFRETFGTTPAVRTRIRTALHASGESDLPPRTPTAPRASAAR